MLDNETPVLLVSFATQEILTFRHIKTGEVMVGKSNKVEGVRYAAVFTRVEDELEDEVTGGWKLLEVRPYPFH
jgi:import inner membrane translocase subunit TIM44